MQPASNSMPLNFPKNKMKIKATTQRYFLCQKIKNKKKRAFFFKEKKSYFYRA